MIYDSYKYMIKTRASGVLVALVLFVSCEDVSEEPFFPDLPDKEMRTEIKVSSVVRSIETRAPFEGTTATDFTALVPLSDQPGDWGTYLWENPLGGTYGTITFNGTSSAGFDPPRYYPHATDDIAMFGLYPVDLAWQIGQWNSSTNISGKDDIMLAKQITSNKESKTNVLTFNHELTWLDMTVKAESDYAEKAWGSITSMKIYTVQKEGLYPTEATAETQQALYQYWAPLRIKLDPRPNGDKAVVETEQPWGISCWTKGNDGKEVEITDHEVASLALTVQGKNAYCLAPPIIAPSTTEDTSPLAVCYYLGINTENHQSAIYIPLEAKTTDGQPVTLQAGKSTAGMKFAVTLVFKAAAISGEVTIEEWKEAGIIEGNI